MSISRDLYFSIVIPALNEEKLLPKLLEDLSCQSFFKDKFEIIIVDGNSEDKTVVKANKYSKKLNLKIIETNKRNVSYQRNLGASKAEGEWVLFMDADINLENNFLEIIFQNILDNPNCDLFTNYLKTKSKNWKEILCTNMVNFGFSFYSAIKKPAAMGALIGCKKEVVENCKFDSNHKYLEDTFFVRKAHTLGYKFKVFYNPKYYFSFRRMYKQGFYLFIIMHILLQIKFVLGYKFYKEEKLYPMIGGQSYE